MLYLRNFSVFSLLTGLNWGDGGLFYKKMKFYCIDYQRYKIKMKDF